MRADTFDGEFSRTRLTKDPAPMRAILIHSESAGARSLSSNALLEMLQEAGYQAELQSPQDGIAGLPSDNTTMIIAAGGDGTVTKVVTAAPAGARVGVIPLGTANNIAHSLGIAGRPEEIIAGWSTATSKSIDIWRANGPWGERIFIEGCGLGAIARANHHMDAHEITGHSPEHQISVARAALTESLRHGKPVTARLTLDDSTIEGQFLLVEILNFSAVGPRLPLAWSADPSDGLLEIGYSLADRYNEFCAWLSDGASPLSEAPVTLLRSRSVTVEWEHARFRIGDDYWPVTGSPEPAGHYRAKIDLQSTGPCVLIPRAQPAAAGLEPARPDGV